MTVPEPIYRFGDAASGRGELDAARHRLVFAGAERELEPKAFAVLVDLLAHAGELRLRDDLLDAVWGHRHVTPAVLSRAIAQVRKALDDNAESPRFVLTVHALGYRFVAPVDVVATAPSTVAPQARASPQPLRWHRPALVAFGVAVLALVAFAWRPRSIEQALPLADVVATAPRQVAMPPIRLPAQATEIAPQVRALEANLTQRLDTLPGLRLTRGKAGGAGVATLSGTIVGGPGDWRLRMRLVDPASQAPLLDRTYSLQLAKVGETANALQLDVLRRLRPDSPLLAGTEATMDAERLVRVGDMAAAGLWQRNRKDAIASFRRALELDPKHANAWCRLGYVYLQEAYENMRPKEAVIPKATEVIEQGLRLDPASATCLQSKGELLRLTNDRAGAEAAHRRALALDPTLLGSLQALAVMENDEGHFTRGRRMYQALIAEHPEVFWTYCQLVGAWNAEGQPARAREAEQMAYARHPTARNVCWPAAETDYYYGPRARYIRRMQWYSEQDPDDQTYRLSASQAAASVYATALARSELERAGKFDTAAWFLAHVWVQYALHDPAGAVEWLRATPPPPGGALAHGAWLAQSLALAGRRDEAVAEYRRVYAGGWKDSDPAMEQGQSILSPQLLNYATLLDAGDPLHKDLVDSAARHLAAMRAEGFAMPWADYQEAQIAVMRGDVDGAMQALDRAIGAGFVDALALYRDLPWRSVERDPRYQQRKRKVDALAAQQRKLLDDRQWLAQAWVD